MDKYLLWWIDSSLKGQIHGVDSQGKSERFMKSMLFGGSVAKRSVFLLESLLKGQTEERIHYSDFQY